MPGIGEYTAGAILSIAYDIPAPAIDGNVYRVLGRYYAVDVSISKNKGASLYRDYVNKILPT
ncbi:MAG: A/G-specific adenine glycosylase, partial [Muribaculaceae bacterium]|nr:A/G-specific adenine glycosylase [Muribaculaceae bacterium]